MHRLHAARTIKLIQLSDCHLLADPQAQLKGVRPYVTLKNICNDVRRRHADADAVVLTGDLSQHGDAGSYRLLTQLIGELGLPAYALAGNHDNAEELASQTAGQINVGKQAVIGDWQILMLHSAIDNEVAGRISEAELAWLESQLAQPAAAWQLVALHHQPTACGNWIDAIGLRNGDQLLRRLQRESRVRLLIHGHTHQVSHSRHGHVDCYGSPSTWRQFDADSPVHRMDSLPPACRVLQLNGAGQHRSWIEFSSIATNRSD